MNSVIVYTSPTWPYCTQAKEFLKAQGISYVEKDVSVDQSAAAELRAKGIMGVPAFIIGNQVVSGLDKEKILKLIDTKVIECPNCRTRLRIPSNKGTLKINCKKCGEIFKVKSW